jgi:endonuclease YncB( thermonuclease family)
MKNLVACLVFVVSTFAYGLTGKVISIADGDTLTVLTANKQQIKVRLSGIDTPEKAQAYGTKAKQALSTKVYGKVVEVKDHGKDRYGRTIGDIYLGKRWINLEMVQEGWAWHYKAYSKDERIAQAEQKARTARKGLWAEANPTPPWDFRSAQRSGSSSAGSSSGASEKQIDDATMSYWLNTSSNVRHNSGCRYYKNTKKGRACRKDEGKACGICGG